MVSDTELTLMVALWQEAGREQYGLGLIEDVKAMRGGKRSIPIGTVHTTLSRLEKKGFVAGRWGADSERRRGARRRYYKLSPSGAAVR